jgi:uncharacterized protein (DUF2235 family)
MKRIVICADGTWNHRDQVEERTGKRRPTNVTKIARAVLPRSLDGTDQIVCYHDGLGTSGPLDRVTGGAFGRGIENNVRVLYRFIVYNFEPGDQLFFFGFSRGAFTVRTLAGFMFKVGLVEKDDDYYVPDIYRCYEDNADPGSAQWIEAFHNVHGTRPCPENIFVGVWDTVGALGAPGVLGQLINPNKYKYHDVSLNPTIRHAYHALAIDEQRKAFAPSLWERPIDWPGTLEQAWFSGVHTNVGGSCSPDGLANEALHWIAEKAESLGLALDSTYLAHFRPCFNSTIHNLMTPMYRALGRNVRTIGDYTPHGEVVHQSAIDRMNWEPSAYHPHNLKDYLEMSGSPRITDTRRLPRGTPCPDLI